MFLEKRNGGTEMLECEIEIGKEERDALLEITLNSKEYRKKRKAEAIKFSILIVACILIIIWRVTNSDTRLVVLCSLLAAYSLFMICGGSKLMQKTVLKKSVTAMDKELKSGYRKYTFSEDGILLKSEVSEGNTAWTLYKDWEIYGNYICIRNLSNENVLVKQDKLSAEERTWLIDLLTRHLGKAVNEK